jgi:C1A family cysteine protease
MNKPIRKCHKYSWIPDVPDHRDKPFKIGFKKKLFSPMLPNKVDLRPEMPPIYDQGSLGSCTANAVAACSEYLWRKAGKSYGTPSRLFIYFNERRIENTINEDSGAQLRDGMKALATWGTCSETEWPYDTQKFSTKPSKSCYTSAQKHKDILYRYVNQNLLDMRTVLAQGIPFTIGVAIYESFESDQTTNTGIISMPGDERSLGGHAMCVVGYDNSTQSFIVRNSWGPQWGEAGYCMIPYAYLTNPDLSCDFWAVTSEIEV